MATNATTANTAGPDRDPVAANYGVISGGTVAAGVLLVAVSAVCFFLLYRSKGYNALPYAIWAALLGVFYLVLGVLAANRGSGRWTDAERGRTVVLFQVGSFGLATALLGLALPFAYTDVFGGDLKVWREHMDKVLLCGAILFGGMLVMFTGLQLARGFGAAFPNLRRTVFGYNAVLGSALVFCILGLINLLPYIQLAPFKYLKETYDWTERRMYSLAPESKNILKNLTQPVKVYVILYNRDWLQEEVRTLLNNCKEVTPNLISEVVGPEYNPDRFSEMQKKYQIPDVGLLVLYGTEPNVTSEFVRRSDLFKEEPSMNPTERPKRAFTGERALMNAISYLAQGRTKITVYFTQGHGETSLEVAPGGGPFKPPASLSALREALEGRNFTVKPLNLDADPKALPEDASVVAVVAPTKPYEPAALAALRGYLQGAGRKEKGHLIVLLGPARSEKGPLAGGGVESLLAEYGVRAGQDRVLSASLRLSDPRQVVAIADEKSTNPLARSLFSGGEPEIYLFEGCRTVSALQPGKPGVTVDPLLYVVRRLGSWVESNLGAEPEALAAEMRANEALLRQKMGKEPIAIAVTVAEGGETMPQFPGHPPIGGSEAQPRMAVFGSANWAADRTIRGGGGPAYVDLFASSLYWLRERPNLGEGSAGKAKDEYSLPVRPEGNWRLVLLPVALLLLGVVMLGSGIWVVRRR